MIEADMRRILSDALDEKHSAFTEGAYQVALLAMRGAYAAGYAAAEGRDYKCPSCGLETISEETLIARLSQQPST